MTQRMHQLLTQQRQERRHKADHEVARIRLLQHLKCELEPHHRRRARVRRVLADPSQASVCTDVAAAASHLPMRCHVQPTNSHRNEH